MTEIDNELATLDGDLVYDGEVTATLADSDAVWASLAPREQARVIELLVERVAYDGKGGQLAITFRPSGINSFASEMTKRKDDAA